MNFKTSLDRVVREEGLFEDVGTITPTRNLPIVVLVGTDRLADRIRRMDGVRSVARDRELSVQGGFRRQTA